MPERLTQWLQRATDGDEQAADQVLPLVYDSLRQLAHRKMAQEAPGHTLDPTALVHEAYLRLVRDSEPRWRNRSHFFAAAAETMRRILIERARRVHRAKHGGHLQRVPLDEQIVEPDAPSERLIALDEALTRFELLHPRKARVVKLRYFVGLSLEETASALEVSLATVKLDWSFARAWLGKETTRDSGVIVVPRKAQRNTA
jgi:RNA polymerase sigma factor (TIGR02999 family)